MSGAASALSGSGSDVSRTKVDAYAALSSEQFVKIMFAELSNQDPMKPNDSSQLLQQMSSLRSIESDMQLQRKLESLVNQNQFASAGSLIGAYISGLDENYRRVEGLVVSVNRTEAGPVLNLASGARVPFGNMDEVIDPRLLEPPAPNPGPNPGPSPAPTPGVPRSDSAPTAPPGVE
ncbi:MAG: hypothetical protein JNJ48_00085 [Phycisphaerae bacterium]|nr:hypothetical protein [Phycisphaerae bacterium]